MEWSIRKEVDGVITDDPKLFLEVCERFSLEGLPSLSSSGSSSSNAGVSGELVVLRNGPSTAKIVKLYLTAFMFQVFMFIFWRRIAKIGIRKARVQMREGVPTAA